VTCQEVDELAAVFALGAMPREEREAVRQHIATCARHEALLADLNSTISAMDEQVRIVEPPATLRAQIMEAVRASDRGAPAPVAAQPPPRLSWRIGGLALHPAMAIAAALVAGLLVWNLSLQFGGAGEAEAFVRYMQNDNDEHAWVYYVEEVGVITVQNLGQLPQGMTYQAWTIMDGKPVNLGVVPVSDNGDGYVLLDQHVTEDHRVFITVEADDGDPAPSGRTVLSTEDQGALP
jgi:anti-sigma-K factor RskA